MSAGAVEDVVKDAPHVECRLQATGMVSLGEDRPGAPERSDGLGRSYPNQAVSGTLAGGSQPRRLRQSSVTATAKTASAQPKTPSMIQW
jgi:hypothetical protein